MSKKLNIVLYFVHWNDSIYLPLIKEHYGKFCSRIVMYDNYSTDLSCFDIAKELGFEVRTFGIPGLLDDQQYIDVKNQCWKELRDKGVDYVIVCDADEFIVLDDLDERLCDFDNLSTAPIVNGFNMISEDVPKESIFEITTGAESEGYSKQAIFNPDKIKEIAFVHGCHQNYKIGEITSFQSCRLLHYRQIGGVKRLIKRHTEYRHRLSQFNLKNGMAHHYGRPEWTPQQIVEFNESKIKEWDILKAQARKLW